MIGSLACLACGTALAWTQKMEVVWPMSENDSRARARDLALDAMRTKASNAVGKIVESSETLRDGKLTEEIRTVGISMVKLEDVRDTVKVDASGRSILSVTANATIDDSELGRRAAAMRQDIDKTKAVRRLTDENASLRQQLVDLRSQPGAAPSRAQAVDIQKREVEILDQLKSNDTAVGSTFAPGALLSIATLDADGWEKEKAKIDTDIFGELLRSPVQVKLLGVKQDGNKYLARVQVGWQPNLNSIYRILKRNFELEPPSFGKQEISKGISKGLIIYDKNRFSEKTSYSNRAWTYLSEHSIWIEIAVAGTTRRMPVLNKETEGFTSSYSAKEIYIRQSGNLGYVELPLTRGQVENATEVKTKLFLLKPDDSSVLSWE